MMVETDNPENNKIARRRVLTMHQINAICGVRPSLWATARAEASFTTSARRLEGIELGRLERIFRHSGVLLGAIEVTVNGKPITL